MDPTPILFIVDECLPRVLVGQILAGQTNRFVDLGTKDPAILVEAEHDGAVIVTADTWFYRQLRRIPHFDKGVYSRAGVVQIPGVWADAEPLLRRWRPVIEAVHRITREEADQRVVVDLRANGAVYIDP